MARKRRTAEQIIRMLKQADVLARLWRQKLVKALKEQAQKSNATYILFDDKDEIKGCTIK